MTRIPSRLALVATGAFACTAADDTVDTPALSDSAGVTIVVNREPQWRDGDGWTVSTQPLVTIGVLEGPSEYQLFRVAAAARQSDGDIVVVEGGSGWSKDVSAVVRLYDREGTFLKTLGGEGSGPGEFLNPDQVLVDVGDTVTVWDNGTRRATRFDPSGELVDIQTVDLAWIAKAVDPPLYPATMRVLPGGDLLVRLTEQTPKMKGVVGKGGIQEPGLGSFRARSGALRVSLAQQTVDTVMFFGDVEQQIVAAPWGDWEVVPPAARVSVIAIQPTGGRVCVGEQVGTEIVCVQPDGLRTAMRWAARPVPLSEEAIDSWRDTTVALYTQKLSETEVLRVLEQVAIPEAFPPYGNITLDAAGNLWVGPGGSRNRTSATDHLVFDRGGVLLGTVSLPPMEVLEIGEDYVLGITRDELAVEYLNVYAIAKPLGSATDDL